MPTVEDSTIVWTQSTTIPDIFTGNVSFRNGGTHSSYSFAGGFSFSYWKRIYK